MSVYKYFGVGCCCCITIGIDKGAEDWGYVTDCITCDLTILPNLKDDISLIDLCDVVLCGPTNSCTDVIEFDASQYGTISTWISNGGRLYCQGEYLGCYTPDRVQSCNDFMSGIGCSLTLGNSVTCGSCNHPQGIVNEDLGVNEDVEHIYFAATNDISGGEWIAKTNGPDTDDGTDDNQKCNSDTIYIAGEQIGNGFVVLGGDSNLSLAGSDGTLAAGCPPGNCPFFTNYFTNSAVDIL